MEYKQIKDFQRFRDILNRHLLEIMKSETSDITSYNQKYMVVWNQSIALKNIELRFFAIDIVKKLVNLGTKTTLY